MATLLTWAEQQAIKPLSGNNEKKFAQMELETENYDLCKLLGINLLQNIQDNPTDANNVILLSGGSYVDCDGLSVKFKGLKYILAYLVAANYYNTSDIQDTFSGMVQHNRSESSYISKGRIEDIVKETREKAFFQFDLLKNYLDKNAYLYPLWKPCKTNTDIYRPKIEFIQRKKYNSKFNKRYYH